MFVSSRRRARVCEPSPARICVSACRSTRSTFPFSRLFTEFKGPFFLENVDTGRLVYLLSRSVDSPPRIISRGRSSSKPHFRPLQITSSSAKQISAIFYTFHARLLFRREGLPQGGRDFLADASSVRTRRPDTADSLTAGTAHRVPPDTSMPCNKEHP